MSKVVIVGGGAAGMMAAIMAARNQNQVIIFEKNEKLGKKLFITGKGRCNVTNACDVDSLFHNVMTNDKFMYSSFYQFDNHSVMDFFEELGTHLKVERGDRVFPVSNHSSDIIKALSDELKRMKVKIEFNKTVKSLAITPDNQVTGVNFQDKSFVIADAVIVATGGISYPITGSNGDGYKMANSAGLEVTKCYPSLVPLTVTEGWCFKLQGLSLKNVQVTIWSESKKKEVYSEFGEMLFTHFGVSGPLILSASSFVTKEVKEHPYCMEIDLKPALSDEQLDRRIIRDFEENQKRQFKNAVNSLFPAKLIPVMIELSGIDPECKVHQISRELRQKFVQLIKHLPLTIIGTRDYNEAIITKGGVSVKEINPSTMESKKVKGLYFAGEVLDVDALTGGFNLQIAWSTGYTAGSSIW